MKVVIVIKNWVKVHTDISDRCGVERAGRRLQICKRAKKKKNPPSCRGKADAFTTRLEVERVAVLGRVSHTQWVWLSTMNACDSRDGEDGGKTKDSCH